MIRNYFCNSAVESSRVRLAPSGALAVLRSGSGNDVQWPKSDKVFTSSRDSYDMLRRFSRDCNNMFQRAFANHVQDKWNLQACFDELIFLHAPSYLHATLFVVDRVCVKMDESKSTRTVEK